MKITDSLVNLLVSQEVTKLILENYPLQTIIAGSLKPLGLCRKKSLLKFL